MSMQNVDGALGYYSYDLLGYRQSFASSLNGRGPSTPLPEYETSFAPEPKFDQGSDLRIEQGEIPSFDLMLQAQVEEFLFACSQAAEQDIRARREAANAESFLFAIQKFHENGVAFSGNTPEELVALDVFMEEANPGASVEERVNLVYELTDYTRSMRAQMLAGPTSEPTETIDSHPALVPRREVLTS